ncbi:hypothetical protein [Novosphingobium resinovorum]|uniref:hypothetical protein n=1 Tax=Novosphingobium resinovorum TaxID=158500 RepID=UPI003D2C3ED6
MPTVIAQDDGTLRRIPSLEELEKMSPEDFEALLGAKVVIDMPPAARRSADEAGMLGADEGGLPLASLAGQNGSLIRVALEGNRGQLVSRWGHILLRRALASRLNPPSGMSAADFMAMRVGLLLRMGETDAARVVLQDLDIADYTPAFGQVAFDVYARNADFTGMCPVMATQGSLRDDAAWNTSRTICEAFRGNSTAAISKLERDRVRGKMDQIDLLLAQKYAGAAGKARRAVTIEWDKVTTMTPWRYGLAIGTGLEPPTALMATAGRPTITRRRWRRWSALAAGRRRRIVPRRRACCPMRRWWTSIRRSSPIPTSPASGRTARNRCGMLMSSRTPPRGWRRCRRCGT